MAAKKLKEHLRHVLLWLFDKNNSIKSTEAVEEFRQLGWEVLDHPPYSPDLAPSDYKAFLSLQNWLKGKEFATEAELRQSIQDWIDSRPAGFWVMGFTDLPERWRKVIEYEGDYFPED
uniref:Transposase n=1 Tax=Acrobeloides nanus TaxID=290746 RepID=A0A914DE31_9BILA